MDAKLKEAFLNLYHTFKQQDDAKTDRLAKWRNIEPESAAFLSFLVQTKQATNIVEIGTSNGFSTLWLAEAVSHTNGFVTTMDIEAERTREAKQHLEHFNLDQRVVLHTCDAALFLKQATPDYDLILLDAERSYYTSYWPDLSRLLQHSNALLVVDNVVSHADQVTDFVACIDDDVYHKIVVPIGAGLLLVSKKN